MTGQAQYLTCCIHSTAEAIQDMTDKAREITFRTALRHIGRDALSEVFPSYDWGPRQKHHDLRMKDDWHVSYHKSQYLGQPCWYVRHSAIEYIFV